MGTHFCIAGLLLSLTAGAFLLAKTKKDNLGVFYKVISWFVMVFSVTALLCSIMCRMANMEYRMHSNNFHHRNMMFENHRHIIFGNHRNMMFGKNHKNIDDGNSTEESDSL